ASIVPGAVGRPWVFMVMLQDLREGGSEGVGVFVGGGFGGGDDQQVFDVRIVRQKARGRDAGDDIALRQRVDNISSGLWQLHRELVEERRCDQRDALHPRELVGQRRRLGVVDTGEASQALFPQQRKMDRERQAAEAGVGADV